MSNMKTFSLLTFILVVLLSAHKSFVHATMSLSSERRLDNILVYISDNVPEGDGKLLNYIKIFIMQISKRLYKATNNMARGKVGVSFGEVHVRVPLSWNIKAEPITWQQCVKSEFKIVTPEMNGNGNKPYTKQLDKCGNAGEFIRLTDVYFKETDSNNSAMKEKEVMTEFLKLRYGVFSEEPYRNVLYDFDGSDFIQSSCPHNIQWETKKDPEECSDKNNKCKYVIKPNQSHNYSVMFDLMSQMSEYICNDDTMPHNKKAYSLHNIKCDFQSVSSVILKHPDFLTTTNEAAKSYKEPIIRIVKAVTRKIVLLLDISGSMYPMINATKKALKHFISYTIEDNAEVGIVVFSKKAFIVSKLLRINKANKDILLSKIDKLRVFGTTNIGDGLLKSVEVLGGSIRSSDKLYGTIIFLSDGESNENTTIDYQEAIKKIIEKGIVTYTISYGNISDPDLNRLAKETGGMFLYAPAQSSEAELFTKFSVQKPCDVSQQSQVKAVEGNFLIDSKSTLSNFTYIDKYIGENTVINVQLEGDISKTIVQLISPFGMVFHSSSRSMSKNVTSLTFKITGKPGVGMYKLKLIPRRERRYKRSVFNIPIKFQIASQGSSVNPEGSLSTTKIDMVNESSQVRATIDLSNLQRSKFLEEEIYVSMKYPNDTTLRFRLIDDGAGDDSIEGDGIYSRIIYAKSFSLRGFYQFTGHIQLIDKDTKDSIIRTIEMESLRVHNVSMTPVMDIVPPSTIQEVHIVNTIKDQRIMTILFTAPGDDGMTGSINQYEVKINDRKKVIFKKFIESTNPFEYVAQELYLSEVEFDEKFQLSVRGIDPVGNAGIWSKFITVHW